MYAVSKEILICNLDVGVPLEGDIVDVAGKLLFRCGEVLGKQTIDDWLKAGFTKVRMHASAKPAAGSLLSEYDTFLMTCLNDYLQESEQLLDDVVVRLTLDEQTHVTQLATIFQTLTHAVELDSDAVLFCITAKDSESEAANTKLAKRCVLLASIGATVAACLGLSRDECAEVATAGLLHDISLFEEPLAIFQKGCQTKDDRQNILASHAALSAELVSRCKGLNDSVRISVSQIHEQIDGSGFPRGISGRHMSLHSRLLNIVDAFLTLTDPDEVGLIPSDAMAYLVGRTTRGEFDRDCMKALLKAQSVYPVGSHVIMDDDRIAMVLRSTRTDPLRPVVRLSDVKKVGSVEIIDLRTSEFGIKKPDVTQAKNNRRRLRRSELNQVLWKPRYAP